MERYTLTGNYFKVHVSFLQEQELLVAAADAEAAEKLVRDSVLPETQQFTLHSVTELPEEEKQAIIRQMMGFAEPENQEADPSIDKRTLN